ncbi:MAG: chemotaxis protein CheA [Deltaproteobacteria bacterium]|nr:chemotaxis protein CheA [Candidatus Zymogenaceae bacterium]
MDMSRYKKIFMEESREHLGKLGSLSLEMEKEPENMEVINAIFREAHSIKGMAASMGYTPISELTHKVEDLMDLIRKGEIGANSHIVDVMLRAIDVLEAQLNAIESGGDIESGLPEVLDMIERSQKGDIPQNKLKTAQKQAPATQKEPPEVKEEQAAYVVTLTIKGDEPKPNVKGLLGVKKLSEFGRVVRLVPGLEEIRKGLKKRELRATLVTGVGNDDVIRALKDLSYLESFDVSKTTVRSRAEGRNDEPAVPHDDRDAVKVGPVDGFIGQGDSTPPDPDDADTPVPGPAVDKPPVEWITEELAIEQEKVVIEPLAQVASPGSESSFDEGPRVEEMLPSGEAGAGLPRSVRIGTDLLESFINIVGELLITKSRIQQQAKNLGITPLSESVNRLESLIRELHTKVITVRMMPLESILSRMPRLVRDLAREKGKEIEFTITGGDIELDRAILEELTDPVVHILRNAVDHGIEPPNQRQMSAKSPTGKITLSAYRERDLVILEFTDDGRGIDPEKIREAAVSRGIMKKQQIDLLKDGDVLLLAFMPSLSTNKEVSDISGRGVGMDVVKTKVESLGGSVRLESRKGQGTKVVLILPLTVAIIQALLIKSAGETFALPLSKTLKSAEVAAESVQMSQNQRVVSIDGDMTPLFRLRDLIGSTDRRIEKEYISLVISEVRGKHIGLEVDEIVGSQEIFIKSLGYPLEKIQGFSGVTILGDGKPVLIIDIGNLF